MSKKYTTYKNVHVQEVEDSEKSEDDSSFFFYSVGSSFVPEDEQFYEVVEVGDTLYLSLLSIG